MVLQISRICARLPIFEDISRHISLKLGKQIFSLGEYPGQGPFLKIMQVSTVISLMMKFRCIELIQTCQKCSKSIKNGRFWVHIVPYHHPF